MKAVFNKGLEDSITLEFDAVQEAFSQRVGNGRFCLEFTKGTFPSVETTMVEYCKDLFSIKIQNIYCYADDEKLNADEPFITFNKYDLISKCSTFYGLAEYNDNKELDDNVKTGSLTLWQTRGDE